MLLLSATYDGFRKKAVLKFYEPKNKEIYLWHDKSDHKPYCLIGRDGIDSNFLDELKTKNNLPGKILKIEKGNLSIGNDADFCIVDINKPWIVKKEKLVSKWFQKNKNPSKR